MICRPHRTITRSLIACVVATLVGVPAWGQSERIVVSTPQLERPARTDVTATCPGIVDVLNNELAPSVLMQGKEGTVHVQFRLQGGRVRDVVSSGGPREYRLPIRSALRGVQCLPGQEGDRFVFALRFDVEPQGEVPRRLALLVSP